jgi:tryptophan-rich sensory protein
MTPTLIAVAATVALILLGGVTTKVGDWYRNLNKPPWNPPTWLFGPAWTVILACVGWAGLTAWTQASDPAARRVVTALFGVNLVFYLAWSPLFFWLRRPDWALIEVVFLWLSILALVVGLAPISPTASLLLAPYLLWVSFASVLNLSIVRRNAPFGTRGLPTR